ncbi:MAG: lipase family protein [Pseudomonadota bacterium]
MGNITPKLAAELASDIYDVQTQSLVATFLEHPLFSQKTDNAKHLKAEVGFRLINASDGFGICVRGGVGFEKDIFMMFRGTTGANYGADIITDLRFGVETSKTGLPVHIGFNTAFCSMLPGIQEFLNKQTDATGTIHIIGHSLGGAVAAIAADWINSAKANTVKLYTFGAPKPGLEFFAKRLTSNLKPENIYRVYHATDVVPMVPVYPFAHAPFAECAYQLPSSSFISPAAHKMVNYTNSVAKSSWKTLKKTGISTADDRSIERWIKSDKPLNPANPKTWEWINAGLAWVLRRIIGGAAVYMQAPLVSAFSLADKIAWVLRKGIDLSVDAGGWVLSLMRKIMQSLGMKLAKTAKELTQLFMRRILQQLMERMADEARRAIKGLFQD